MRITIDVPSSWEIKSVEVKNNRIIVEPRFQQSTQATVAFVLTEGAGGLESRSTLIVNSKDGIVRTRTFGGPEPEVLFDLTPDEYQRRVRPKRVPERKPSAEQQQAPAQAPSATGPTRQVDLTGAV